MTVLLQVSVFSQEQLQQLVSSHFTFSTRFLSSHWLSISSCLVHHRMSSSVHLLALFYPPPHTLFNQFYFIYRPLLLLYVSFFLLPPPSFHISFPVIYPLLTLSFTYALLFLTSSSPVSSPLSPITYFFSVHLYLSLFLIFIHSPPLSFSPSAHTLSPFLSFPLCHHLFHSFVPLFPFPSSPYSSSLFTPLLPLFSFLLLFCLPHTCTHTLSLFHPLFFSCRSSLP